MKKISYVSQINTQRGGSHDLEDGTSRMSGRFAIKHDTSTVATWIGPCVSFRWADKQSFLAESLRDLMRTWQLGTTDDHLPVTEVGNLAAKTTSSAGLAAVHGSPRYRLGKQR